MIYSIIKHLLKYRFPSLYDRMILRAATKDIGWDWKSSCYFDEAELDIDRKWRDLIWPFIKDCDFSCVVDLAAGHGRNSDKLREVSRLIYIVDINQECIDFCKRRFGSNSQFRFLRTSGTNLKGIGPEEVTLVYCFDSMVHFDSDVIRAYLREFSRVLRPGGYGFCHHSNYIKNPCGSFREHEHGRNFMSEQLFAHYCAKEGLSVVKQKAIDWVEPQLDCLTLFKKPLYT